MTLGLREVTPGPRGPLAIYHLVPENRRKRRLLVLKLDHRGDFLIGVPALDKLRKLFATDHITLVCGSWNVDVARQSQIADEVCAYDFFPENGAEWTGEPFESVNRLKEICHQDFDIAIDLRVDEDTRFLLDHIKAATKCGVGSRARHPYLDIILPPQFERRESDDHWLLIDPDRFESKMPRRMPLFHENDFSVTNTHLVYGPYIQLPEGRFRAHFGLRLRAPFPRFPGVKIVLDVARKTETIAARQILWRHSGEPRAASIEFTNNEAGAKHEFRIHARGRPVLTRLRFSGVRLEQTDGSQARLKPAELHIGEQLSLLVDLICQRIHNFHPTFPFAQGSGSFDLTMSGMGPSTKTIVVAPISHSSIRDWGIPNYARLIELLLQKLPCCVVLVGSNSQRDQLNLITAENGRDRRVINLAGRSNWSQTAAIVRDADLVISNNSGIGHLAAACATPTLSIFSGSHQPQEWGPRGNGVLVMMASVPCSPCGHHRIEFCPNDHLCMKQIVPETVAEQAIAILNSDFVRLREQYRDGQVFERH